MAPLTILLCDDWIKVKIKHKLVSNSNTESSMSQHLIQSINDLPWVTATYNKHNSETDVEYLYKCFCNMSDKSTLEITKQNESIKFQQNKTRMEKINSASIYN